MTLIVIEDDLPDGWAEAWGRRVALEKGLQLGLFGDEAEEPKAKSQPKGQKAPTANKAPEAAKAPAVQKPAASHALSIWEEFEHPRVPAGQPGGGEFEGKPGGEEGIQGGQQHTATDELRAPAGEASPGEPAGGVPADGERGNATGVPGESAGAGERGGGAAGGGGTVAAPGEGAGGEGIHLPGAGEDPGLDSATEEDAEAEEELIRPLPPASTFSSETRAGNNYRITGDSLVDDLGNVGKFNANVAALRLLRQLEEEGRFATPEEQDILARYSGWGWGPQYFSDNAKDYKPGSRYWKYREQRKLLQSLMTPEEFDSAGQSTLNAHYTSPVVIRAMWEAVRGFGFEGGKVLEPSCGVGHFFGCEPEDLAARSSWVGVDMDMLSARFSEQLYQGADIRNTPIQDANLPNDSFDLVISNVPFGKEYLDDPKYEKDPEKRIFVGKGKPIHNYFFAKALDQVRPGGIVAFVTSHFTADATTKAARMRRYYEEKSDLLGMVRLPQNAFEKNAGTQVVTDVIFLRKRAPGEKPNGESWSKTVPMHSERTFKSHGGYNTTVTDHYDLNEYYERHPEMALGEHSTEGTQYDDGQYTLKLPKGEDFKTRLEEAVGRLPRGVYTPATTEATDEGTQSLLERIPAPDDVVPGGYTVRDGRIYQNNDGTLEPVSGLSEKQTSIITRAMEVCRAARACLRAQIEHEGDHEEVLKTRKVLNEAYDRFRALHGPLSYRYNHQVMFDSPDYAFLMALENDDPGNPNRKPKDRIYTKADIFSKRTVNQDRVLTAGTAKEAMLVALAEKGWLHWDRMSELLGRPAPEIQAELAEQGLVFHNPGGDWETTESYLSGNVRQKLKEAESAAINNPDYERNVEALQAVQPVDLTPEDIDIQIGAKWVPPDVYNAFLVHLFGGKWPLGTEGGRGRYNTGPNTGGIKYAGFGEHHGWMIERSQRKADVEALKNHTHNTATWGTSKVSAIELLDMALNDRRPVVRETEKDPITGEKHTYVDREATAAAEEKLKAIKKEFESWWKQTPEVAQRLVKTYNQQFNHLRVPKYNGQHLHLPGLSVEAAAHLKPHVKDAVWRCLQGGNTLLAHCVGSGKTWQCAAAAMEMRRLGIARKPMVIVPNHLIGQWAKEFVRMYPSARVLMAPQGMTGEQRRKLMSQVATQDWDAVIVGHSEFGRTTMSEKSTRDFYQEQVNAAVYALQSQQAEEGAAPISDSWKDVDENESDEKEGDVDLKSGKGDSPTVKQLKRKVRDIRTRMKKKLRLIREKGDKSIQFEDLGVDRLFVDECFTADTLVATDYGAIPIGRIVEEELPVRVVSCNLETGALEFKPVIRWIPRELNGRLVRVTHQRGSFLCTPNHKIWTHEEGYVLAGALTSQHTLRWMRSGVRDSAVRKEDGSLLQQDVRDRSNEGCASGMEVSGSSEDRDPECSRVVRVEVLERGGAGQPGESLAGDPRLPTTVYDLEVADNHNYFAGGVLVSNCHAFKNLYFTTQRAAVKGLAQSESDRAFDMFMKTRHITQKNNGTGVVFATGTPIANTMAEMYTMMRYLAYDKLKEAGFESFDAWAKHFGRTVTSYEQTMERGEKGTHYKPVERFAEFINLADLTAMFRQFSDVLTSQQLDVKRPKLAGGKRHEVIVPMTPRQKAFFLDLADRADALAAPGAKIDPKIDNPLKVYAHGRMATLDVRLVDPGAGPEDGNKIAAVAENIHRMWDQTHTSRSTQVAFLDMGVPKSESEQKRAKKNAETIRRAAAGDDEEMEEEYGEPGVDQDELTEEEQKAQTVLYADLKKRLMAKGIPENEIAFIHDAKTTADRQALFDKVQRGDVRVLIGSTEKMGTGMNVQKKLIALHHIDCPWRPCDLEQREGRILRQGNDNPEAHIFSYVTRGDTEAQSMDALMWDTVARKARFIDQVMNADTSLRRAEDISLAASAAQIAASCRGDDRWRKKAELDHEIDKLDTLHTGWLREQSRIKMQQFDLGNKIQQHETQIGVIQNCRKSVQEIPEFSIHLGGRVYGKDQIVDAGNALLQAVEGVRGTGEVRDIGAYRGLRIAVMGNGPKDPPSISIRPASERYANEETSVSLAASDSASNNLNRLRSLVGDLGKLQEKHTKALQETKDNLGRLKDQVNDTWEHTDRLREALAQRDQLARDLGLMEDEAGPEGDGEDVESDEREVEKALAAFQIAVDDTLVVEIEKGFLGRPHLRRRGLMGTGFSKSKKIKPMPKIKPLKLRSVRPAKMGLPKL